MPRAVSLPVKLLVDVDAANTANTAVVAFVKPIWKIGVNSRTLFSSCSSYLSQVGN